MNNLIYPVYGGQIISKAHDTILYGSKSNELILYTVSSNLRMLFGVTSNYPTMIMDYNTMIMSNVKINSVSGTNSLISFSTPISVASNSIFNSISMSNLITSNLITESLVTSYLDSYGDLTINGNINTTSNIKINDKYVLTSNTIYTSFITSSNDLVVDSDNLHINTRSNVIFNTLNDLDFFTGNNTTINTTNTFTLNTLDDTDITTNRFSLNSTSNISISTSDEISLISDLFTLNNSFEIGTTSNLLFTFQNKPVLEHNSNDLFLFASNVHFNNISLSNVSTSFMDAEYISTSNINDKIIIDNKVTIKSDVITSNVFSSNIDVDNIYSENITTSKIAVSNVSSSVIFDKSVFVESNVDIKGTLNVSNINSIIDINNNSINLAGVLNVDGDVVVNGSLLIDTATLSSISGLSNINDSILITESNIDFTNKTLYLSNVNDYINFSSNQIQVANNIYVNDNYSLRVQTIDTSFINTTAINDNIVLDGSNIYMPGNIYTTNITVPYISTSNINDAIYIVGSEVKFADDLILRFSGMETSNINDVILFSIDNSNVTIKTNFVFNSNNVIRANTAYINNIYTSNINDTISIYPLYLSTTLPIITTRYVYSEDIYTYNINDNITFGVDEIVSSVPIYAPSINLSNIQVDNINVKTINDVVSFTNSSVDFTYSNETILSITSNGLFATYFNASNLVYPDSLLISQLKAINNESITMSIDNSNIAIFTSNGIQTPGVYTSNINFDESLSFTIGNNNIGYIDSNGFHISMLLDDVTFNQPDLYVRNMRASNIVQGGIFVIDKVMTSYDAEGNYNNTVNGSNLNVAKWLSPLESLHIFNNISVGGASLNTEYPLYIENETADNISAYVKGSIIALSTETFSDVRIKKDITSVDSEKAYNKVMGIDVCDYTYIESSVRRPGFIAQQLEEVCPEGVRTIKDFIPDIIVNVNVYYIYDDMISVDMVGDNIKLGTRLKLKLNNGSILIASVISRHTEYMILQLNKNDVKNNNLKIGSSLIIVGREVDDFKVIDYNIIISYLVSSIQHLSTKI
jgi:hypothetical protein